METTPATIDQALELTGSEALAYFTNKKNIDQIAKQVREEALALSNAFSPDTKSGRDGIGSTALKVSKSKKVITDKLDHSAAKHRAELAKITTAKKLVEAKFKEIRDEVLRPRNQWQAEQDRIESERVAQIKKRIDNIMSIGDFTDEDTIEQLSEKIDILNSIDASDGFEELYWEATRSIKDQISKLNERIISVVRAGHPGRNHDNKQKKDTLNIHQNVENLLSEMRSGDRSMYCVWVDVLETLQTRRMYPVIAKSEEEARSHIEKSLGMLGEKLDHKDCVIINKHVDIGQVFEVSKQ